MRGDFSAMVNSMTAFATQTGTHDTVRWVWEVRGVNGRGLDIRVRVPDGCEALDQTLRAAASAAFARGTIQASLKVSREVGTGQTALDAGALATAISAAREAEVRAAEAGLDLAPSRATDLLALKGVMDQPPRDADDAQAWQAAVKKGIPALVANFAAARATEGAALLGILQGQITRVSELTGEAEKAAAERAPVVAETLRSNLAAVLDNTDGVDEARLAQELAILAVKADVTEELDRLGAHIDAARELLATEGPIGRKFDFLMQEFNREANTLCSKSGSKDLTRIGLDLKTVIDQMREQVQNVE
jgi:uncharacterized protein (TIGR00255 family)